MVKNTYGFIYFVFDSKYIKNIKFDIFKEVCKVSKTGKIKVIDVIVFFLQTINGNESKKIVIFDNDSYIMTWINYGKYVFTDYTPIEKIAIEQPEIKEKHKQFIVNYLRKKRFEQIKQIRERYNNKFFLYNGNTYYVGFRTPYCMPTPTKAGYCAYPLSRFEVIENGIKTNCNINHKPKFIK